MKTLHDFHVPAVSRLFSGLTSEQAKDILTALGAITIAYTKGEKIINQWTKATHHYLVVSGEVHSYYDHTNGRRSVNGVFRHGDSFGLVFAFSDLGENPSNAIAMSDSVVIKIPLVDIINNDLLIETKARRRFIQNSVNIMSQAAFESRLRSFVLEQPTIEGRIRTYLNEISKHNNSCDFVIPFDRQEFADFVCCSRQSLCMTLTKMREKGIVDFSKNHFWIRVPYE